MVVSATALHAADTLRGADSVLKEVAEAAQGQQAAAPKDTRGAEWSRKVVQLSKVVDGMAPKDAAQAWLGLADGLAELKQEDFAGPSVPGNGPMAELMQALPPPAAWQALAEAIAARPEPASLKAQREFGLRFMGAALIGDWATLSRQVRALETQLIQGDPRMARGLIRSFSTVDEFVQEYSDDVDSMVASLDRQLTASEKPDARWYRPVRVPDLVALMGEERATPWLKRALLSKAADLQFEGSATRALARKILLGVVNDLKIPRWGLATDLDSMDVYEALEKKFEVPSKASTESAASAIADLEQGRYDGDYEKNSAKTYYLMGLIARGRIEDATAFVERTAVAGGPWQLETSAVLTLERAGYARALDDFLHDVLSRNPKLPLWKVYLSAAARAGNTDRMLALARSAAANPGLDPGLTVSIRRNLFEALLAADKIDEAVAALRNPQAEAAKPDGEGDDNFDSGSLLRSSGPGLTLARLGVLLERPAWVSEGLDLASRDLPGEPGGYLSQTRRAQRIAILVAEGRLADAEQVLATELADAVRPTPAARRGGYPDRMASQRPLELLVGLYHRAGRHADVLSLLEKSPYWGFKDVLSTSGGGYGGADIDPGSWEVSPFVGHIRRHPMAVATATALLRVGRVDEARPIVNFLLDHYPDDDRGYELLLELTGNDALPRLEELFARDPFQERPLIWKSLLLFKAGRLDEAEGAARQAIRIDPSDGEQGKGDRMRVYSVLADIRAARGDAKEAEVLRGAIRAIRLSERADDFFSAGLLSRAVSMYQESLRQFADAYCIQSRLAVQLSDLGQHELAAQHYQKAFELMPDSFGRIESHCFGCERTFSSSPAQSVAERVFVRLAQENPNKPQIHYLLGYLRDQQGRGKDAMPHFRQALKLDPDYLNAWVRLQEISANYRVPRREQDEIALQILRLDPLRRHANADLQRVSDLRRLWEAVEVANRRAVARPVSLFALRASAEAMKRLRSENQEQGVVVLWGDAEGGPHSASERSPREEVARHGIIRASIELMTVNRYFYP